MYNCECPLAAITNMPCKNHWQDIFSCHDLSHAHTWVSEGGGAHAPWIWMFVKFRSFMASRLFTVCAK